VIIDKEYKEWLIEITKKAIEHIEGWKSGQAGISYLLKKFQERGIDYHNRDDEGVSMLISTPTALIMAGLFQTWEDWLDYYKDLPIMQDDTSDL